MNRKLAVVLSTGIAFLLSVNIAFAQTSIPASQIPNNPAAELTPSQAQMAHTKQKIADAYSIQETAELKSQSKGTSSVTPNSEVFTYTSLGVTPHQEDPDWNCGPCAIYQDAQWKNPGNYYFQSDQDNPNNYPESYNLQTLTDTTQGSGCYCVNIPSPLNEASNTGSWYIAGNINSESNLITDVTYDTANNYPQIADVATEYLDYYNGTNYLHYISVDGYDSEYYNGVFSGHIDGHVVDDNWNNTYYGSHWTTFAGLYNGMSYFGSNANFVW